jgi:hypothetical protein
MYYRVLVLIVFQVSKCPHTAKCWYPLSYFLYQGFLYGSECLTLETAHIMQRALLSQNAK